MAGVGSQSRDLAAVQAGLEAWLRAHAVAVGPGLSTGGGAVRITNVAEPAAGFSSQTLVVDVDVAGRPGSLVGRLPPAGEGLFPHYDLARQARLQEALPGAGVPTARPLALEVDERWVGAEFLLMERVDGRIAGEFPPYWVEGWLHDAAPAEQDRVHGAFLDVLAAVHATDVDALGLQTLGPPSGAGIGGALAEWEAYLAWADVDRAGELWTALQWCRDHQPDPEPPSGLLWGDVRLGNVVVDASFGVVAVLDWEMASIGPAEIDLAWYLALRPLYGGRAELPGFPDRQATIRQYEQRLGRELVDLRWFEVFALLRSAAIFDRIQRLMARQSGQTLEGGAPMLRRLRKLMA
jgi:aminoglycoside phosphotransferase (APT) family kinase protein